MPIGLGPVASGLVEMKREPAAMNRIALVIASNEYERVPPMTTKSGSASVIVKPISCSAVIRPASPTTYAEPRHLIVQEVGRRERARPEALVGHHEDGCA